MWVVAALGIMGAVGCIFIGFFPPDQLADQHIRPAVFVAFLGTGIFAVGSFPYFILKIQKRLGLLPCGQTDKIEMDKTV